MLTNWQATYLEISLFGSLLPVNQVWLKEGAGRAYGYLQGGRLAQSEWELSWKELFVFGISDCKGCLERRAGKPTIWDFKELDQSRVLASAPCNLLSTRAFVKQATKRHVFSFERNSSSKDCSLKFTLLIDASKKEKKGQCTHSPRVDPASCKDRWQFTPGEVNLLLAFKT